MFKNPYRRLITIRFRRLSFDYYIIELSPEHFNLIQMVALERWAVRINLSVF